jgi:hypothetical protein
MRLFFAIFALCFGMQSAWSANSTSPALRSELVKKMSKVSNPSDEQCGAYWNSSNDMPEMQKPTQFEVACRRWAIKELEEYSAALKARIEAEKRKQAFPQATDLNAIREEKLQK